MSNGNGTYLDALLNKTIQSNQIALPPQQALNFGAGFSVTDNPTNGSTDVTATESAPITFASLAALAPSTTRQVVNLDCFATVGDQGGGRFHWDATSTATVDGYSVSYGAGNTNPAVGGRWIRDLGSPWYVDVRWFGVSTSNADNASGYAAINAAMTAAGGGVVHFPAGTFQSSTAYVPANNTVTCGAGRKSTLLSRTTPGSVIYRSLGVNVGGGPQSHYVVRDLGVTNTTSRPTVANNTTYTAGQIVRPKAALTCRWLQCMTGGTAPASGPEPIGQLFAPIATAPVINVTGVPSVSGVVLEVYIEDGLTTFGYSVSGGAAAYQATGVAFTPGGTVALGGTATGLTLHFASGTYLASGANLYVYTSPPFAWSLVPGAQITWGTAVFQVVDAGGGFEENSCSYNSYFNCYATNVEHGFIIDGSENLEIVNPYIEPVSYGFWICNGPDHRPTTLDTHGNLQGTQFTNVITVYGQPSPNGGASVLDDGGIVHTFVGLAAMTPSWLTGLNQCYFSGLYYESSSTNKVFATVALKSYYGGQPYGVGQLGLRITGFFNTGSAAILNVLVGMLHGLNRPQCISGIDLRGAYTSGTVGVTGANCASDIFVDLTPTGTPYTNILDAAPALGLPSAVARARYTGYEGVNIGAANAASALDMGSSLALRSVSKTLANGLNTSSALDAGLGVTDALRPSTIEISGPTGAFQISGLPGGGAPGRLCTLYYYGNQACTFVNNSTAEALAVNGIHTLTGADVTLSSGQFVARFWWSPTLTQWVYG